MASFFHKLLTGLTWVVCRLLPIQPKKIVISSYYGQGYGDNPKAIANELLRRNEGWKIVWLTNGASAAASLPAGVEACDYQSLRKVYELSTAKIWIDNCRKGARIKRRSQIYIQTWHGFALKRIERDVADKLPADYAPYARRDSAQTDLIVSDSRFMTGIYRRAFWYDGEIVTFGAPRNDLLCAVPDGVADKVRAALKIPAGRKIVLYAPTFRANHSLEPYCIDYAALRRSCAQRFGGDFAVAIRLHPAVVAQASELVFDGETTFNACTYPDMQELLAASDVVISDYSSLMFDFGLTMRPCFQFAVDIDEYCKDRNFYFPLDQTPFPLSTDNDELAQNIAAFDLSAYQTRLKAFYDQVGMIADGHAAARCADWIAAHTKGEHT